ncbi:MAG: hypothetical protein UT32_C0015G0020 [Parcubacteria group bacterium GW2011_GWC2_39_14]|nr:MAG: hypothetical protein UT32_C0015G0020 [Parcubacteria group bacterium GW2011_GWC2_39_14]KKR54416.1 MAG: hypothetical protein UT91_C0016G0020 [Parcubacteria group bacterium GW2011_GWA2_40_23]
MSVNIVYQDKVKSSPVVMGVLGFSVIIVLIIGFILYFQNNRTIDSGVVKTLSFVLVLDVFVFWAFREMAVVITDKQLSFGFFIFKKKIDLNKIENVEIQDFKFNNYLGYGIRYGRDNTIGYVPCGGRGLKIKVTGEKKDFFFICNRPEEALVFIKQYGTQK